MPSRKVRSISSAGRRGVVGIVQARIGVPRRDMADTPEAVATGAQMGQQHRFDSAAKREVGAADDTRAGARPAQSAAREHGRHAVDELGLADRAHLRRSTLAIHRLRLHVHRRDDVVAAVHVGQEIVSEVARARANPQVVVRIDDGQLRLENRLRVSRQPVGSYASRRPAGLAVPALPADGPRRPHQER